MEHLLEPFLLTGLSVVQVALCVANTAQLCSDSLESPPYPLFEHVFVVHPSLGRIQLRPRTTAPGTPEGSRVALESGA